MAQDDEKVVEPDQMVPRLSMLNWEPDYEETQQILMGQVAPKAGDPAPRGAADGKGQHGMPPGPDAGP
jgi:hypothetical protein